ncbi:hypothetical protein BH10BAC1_BH10BAC1_21280 [soil metagenome]
METKKTHYDLSLPYSIHSYINSLLQHVNSASLTDNVFENAKNCIVVVSETGYLKKTSASFSQLLNYTEAELLPIPVKHLLTEGTFVCNNRAAAYYFENTITCKSGKSKTFKWRLIPDVMEGCFVFIGWEIYLNSNK